MRRGAAAQVPPAWRPPAWRPALVGDSSLPPKRRLPGSARAFGFPLVDFRVELYDGSYHSVDSSEQAFKMAGILAFRTVAQKCRPVLLEPLDQIEVTTPDAYLGDVMGDLSGRRGQILGTDASTDGRGTTVRAIVPQAELHLYATNLHSLTHGHATFARRFYGYDQMPPDAAQKVIVEHAKEREEALAEA